MVYNVFEECPVYETQRFIFRLVSQTDADDLFKCYSDQTTLQHTNKDNCKGKFHCESIDAMQKIILSWQREYEVRNYVRWSIIEKDSCVVIGTVEIAPIPYIIKFYKGCTTGILRIDLISDRETVENYVEMLEVAGRNFFEDFQIEQIMIKAPINHSNMVAALELLNIQPDKEQVLPFEDYYVLNNRLCTNQ